MVGFLNGTGKELERRISLCDSRVTALVARVTVWFIVINIFVARFWTLGNVTIVLDDPAFDRLDHSTVDRNTHGTNDLVSTGLGVDRPQVHQRARCPTFTVGHRDGCRLCDGRVSRWWKGEVKEMNDAEWFGVE